MAGQYFYAETGWHYNYHRYYDPKTGRYLTPDPIGLLGGINLYSYVQNNPVNYFDPYELINPVKMGVGFVNALRGVKGMGNAVGTFVTGTVAIPFTAGVSGPSAYAIGAAQFAMGFANLNRGVGQMSEGYDESACQSSSKNLLGLLPFGQKYDDALEPGMGEYFSGVWDKFVTDPISTAIQATKDFFAFD